jgi:tetratricopeptide (TPR) repeat protein
MRVVADDQEWDLAVLEVDRLGPRADAWLPPTSPSPVVAEVGTAVEPGCEAVGFPDAAVQHGEIGSAADVVRQSEQVYGTLAPMGQAKPLTAVRRTLPREWMPLDQSLSTPETQRGWGGMSGAGVLLPDGRLVGVVVDAEAARQLRRLYVVPLATALSTAAVLSRGLATAGGGPIIIEPRHAAGMGVRGGVAAPAVRSSYLQQVQRIAPRVLLARDRELAELTEFSTAPDHSPYAWWRAPAWAGKSALMSWFVLHPPPGVRIVSFFITARFAGQDDRHGFADVVLEQLAEVLGQPLPAYLTEATREPHLLELLAASARRCQQRGERLVLVVDGLDEDRGVVGGPDDHSIASLLPAEPPDGLRVVVAGRPDPPIPVDVPDDHPLRDPGIVRVLDPSPYAEAVKADASREIKRLLHGTQPERDLLGLITAARSGLSAQDLAELTGLPEWQISEELQAVPGRTFMRLVDVRGRDRARELYTFGHRELQQAATQLLRGTYLDSYRQRLHDWADRYRAQRWPVTTPEYLLLGYHVMLKEAGDVPRMAACATDQRRHDRMLDLFGGDDAALGEIASTLEAILASAEPDLTAAVLLAAHKDNLHNRNASIPPRLPVVWAALGQPRRAEALARSLTAPETLLALAQALADAGARERAEAIADSITDPYWQSQALSAAAKALAKSGQRERALEIADRVEALCGAISNPYDEASAHDQQARALTSLIGALADAGARERVLRVAESAETAARACDRGDWEAQSLAGLAQALAGAGELRRAEAVADSITYPFDQVQALSTVVVALAETHERDRALAVAEKAEADAFATTNETYQAESLARLAVALARSGEPERAIQVAERAETVALSMDGYEQSRALALIVPALAGAGARERAVDVAGRAEALARSLTFPVLQVRVLTSLASALAGASEHERALHAAACAADAASTVAEPDYRAEAVADVASALIGMREYERAEAAVTAISEPRLEARTLVELALALAGTGARQRAVEVAERAEAVARSTTYPRVQAEVLAAMAHALSIAGDHDRAVRIAECAQAVAQSAPQAREQADALVHAVEAWAGAGDYQTAEHLIGAFAADDAASRLRALTRVVRALTRDGHLLRAVEVASDAVAAAWAIGDLRHRAMLMGHLVECLTGSVERSLGAFGTIPGPAEVRQNRIRDQRGLLEVPDQARALANDANYLPGIRSSALVAVARAMADAGRYADVLEILKSINEPRPRVYVLAAVVEAVAGTGARQQAVEIAKNAENIAQSITDPDERAWALAGLAWVLADAMGYQQAARVIDLAEVAARSATDPGNQAWALGPLVDALVDCGQYERAEATAQLIKPTAHSTALAVVAVGLAKDNRHAKARSLLAQALAEGPWTSLMPAIAVVDPPALQALADRQLEYLGRA